MSLIEFTCIHPSWLNDNPDHFDMYFVTIFPNMMTDLLLHIIDIRFEEMIDQGWERATLTRNWWDTSNKIPLVLGCMQINNVFRLAICCYDAQVALLPLSSYRFCKILAFWMHKPWTNRAKSWMYVYWLSIFIVCSSTHHVLWRFTWLSSSLSSGSQRDEVVTAYSLVASLWQVPCFTDLPWYAICCFHYTGLFAPKDGRQGFS